MTRLLSASVFYVIIAATMSVLGQTVAGPAAPSRYAPQQPGQSYGSQPVQPGGQPAGPYAVRAAAAQHTMAGQQPVVGQPLPGQVGPGPNPAGAIPPGLAAAPAIPPAMPQAPAWAARLTAEEQKWVDDVLGYWEARSERIKLFECKFQRWDYDPVFGPADRSKAKTIAEGVIKYAQPEKGLYRVEKLWSYVAAAKPGEKDDYFAQDASFGEHWVCDGERVFEFDARNKRLIERPLPPEMRGRAIADGPLPFMFGAKAETIKARYWIHALPQTGNGKYWLEAVPKARQDAQNFSRVIIILDETEFLPETLQIFAPNYDEQTNPARQTYAFKDRKTTDQQSFLQQVAGGLNPLNTWFKPDDFNPRVPAGWKKVVENDAAGLAAGPPPGPAAGPPPRQFAPLPR